MKKIVTTIVALSATTALMAGVNAGACKGCHGQNFEKKALGKSKNVSTLSHAEIATALKGYKAGTLNTHGMGSVMKGQVASMDDAAIQAVADHIAAMK